MRYDAKRHRLPICPASGILLADKPKEWTSFDVVNFVRARFNVPKVGHCGTLDPAATGLLVLVLGKFTTASGLLSGDDKQYEAILELGKETDSGDLDGEIISQSEVNLTPAQVIETVNSFTGVQLQTPPMVSAVKVDGKKLYELARKGIEVEREPREIEIKSIKVTKCELPYCNFTLDCSKGTYVRTLCADIGKKLGCGGVLAGLRRTRSGRFHIKDAVTVDFLKTLDQDQFTLFMAELLVKSLKTMPKM